MNSRPVSWKALGHAEAEFTIETTNFDTARLILKDRFASSLMKYPIVIPIHHLGGKFGCDLELKYALRSLDQHFADPFEVCLIGKKKPYWITNIKHIEGGGLKQSLRIAANHYPDGFFWFYDDCCLMKPTSAQQMKITPASNNWGGDKSRWASLLHQVKDRLDRENIAGSNYSRSHGPYWFDKSMIDEAFHDWPDMSPKFPIESWILSKRNWPKSTGEVKQYYGPFSAIPDTKFRYLNYDDKGNTLELREHLRSVYPIPSRFELAEHRGERHTNKHIFFQIPGTGYEETFGVNQKQLQDIQSPPTLPWLNREYYASWMKNDNPNQVAIIREPISRAIATYQNLVSTNQSPTFEPDRYLKEMYRTLGFNGVWEKIDIQNTFTDLSSISPQTIFLEESPVTHLLRYENLEFDILKLAPGLSRPQIRPKHERITPSIQLSPTAAKRIREFYHNDEKLYYKNHHR